MSDLLSESWPAARKPHRCAVCGGIIATGDRYIVQTIKGETDIYRWKAHGLCHAASCMAWDPAWHDYDENPLWDEEVAPFVWAFFEALAGFGSELGR